MYRFVVAACAMLAFPSAGLATPVPPPGPDVPIAEARKYFTEDPDAPMIAPEGYDVTIVEYLDYQCPACRTTLEPLRKLMEKDGKIRLIFRDWPIFGPASQQAARLALASKYQGKYVEFHNALLTTSRPLDDEKMRAAAAKAGINWGRLQKDLESHGKDIEDLLERNALQADMLGLDGTPGFIIGNTQSFGGLTLEQLEESVSDARKEAREAASK